MQYGCAAAGNGASLEESVAVLPAIVAAAAVTITGLREDRWRCVVCGEMTIQTPQWTAIGDFLSCLVVKGECVSVFVGAIKQNVSRAYGVSCFGTLLN